MERRALMGALAACSLPLAATRTSAGVRPTFIHGFGEGSTTGVITQFAASVVLFKSGIKPWIATVPGQQGYAAFQHFQSKSAGEGAYLVADTMTLMLNAVRRATVEQVLAAPPIVKLTNGISIALVASAGSGIERFEDLQAEGARRVLRVAHAGRWSASGVPLAWTWPDPGAIKEVICSGNDTALKALARGEVELAFVLTNSMPKARRETPDLKILTTFGAARSPHFPSVRTYGELVGDAKKSFTISFSLFARPDTPVEDSAALAESFARPLPPRLLKSLDWLAQSIVVNDEQTVRVTVRRDLRVAMSVASRLAPA